MYRINDSKRLETLPVPHPKRRVLTEKLLPPDRSLREAILSPGGSLWVVRKSDCSIVLCHYIETYGKCAIFRNEKSMKNFNVLLEIIPNVDTDVIFRLGHERMFAYTSEKNAIESALLVHIPQMKMELKNDISFKSISKNRVEIKKKLLKIYESKTKKLLKRI